jgi:SAM-dependent methyltransferase
MEAFSIGQAHKILEIGCGEGRDAIPLLHRGYDLLATDISAEAIRFCRKQIPEYGSNFRILDCVEGKLSDTFDFIFAVAVIHMLVEDRDALDLEAVRQKFKDFCAESGASVAREWVYTSTEKPVIIAERYLKDPAKADGSLRDYKIFCFAGKPAYTICVDGRNTDNYCHVVYDTEGGKQDVIIQGSSAAADYEKPAELPRMMEIAGILSEDFPFARVDLYFVEGKIYFGEITYFPWSGYKKFEPDSFDFDSGERFILPEKNV